MPSQHIPFPLVSFSFLLNLQWRKPSNSRVHIDTGPGLQISPISVDNFEFEFNCERNITVHFENVNFTVRGSQITIIRNAVATFDPPFSADPPHHMSSWLLFSIRFLLK
jgi:hypothetical protein